MQCKYTNNPFSIPNNLYLVEFETIYKYKDLIEIYFEDRSLVVSSFEKFSNSIEAEPNDLWEFRVFFDEKPILIDIQKDLIDITSGEVTNFLTSEINDKDWVSEIESNYKPILIDKFYISNSKNLKNIPNEFIPINIDMGMAFGTGDHQTTKGCIIELVNIKNENRKINSLLDVGTGTGILSIISKKIWPEINIDATEIDDVAFKVAKENFIINNTEINLYKNYDINESISKYDIIVANILALPLIEMSGDFYEMLNHNGSLILSGLIMSQSEFVIKEFEKKLFKLESKKYYDNWVVLNLTKF